MNDNDTPIKSLKDVVLNFVHERLWEKYHNPKDLAESICIEASELLEIFQWTTPNESRKFMTDDSKSKQIKEELADVVIYCLSIANTLDIDLTSVILDKLKHNEKKYPSNLYKGKAHLDSE